MCVQMQWWAKAIFVKLLKTKQRNLKDECKMGYFYSCLHHSTNTHMGFPFYKAVIFPLFRVISCSLKIWLFLDLSGFTICWNKAETDVQLDSPLNTESPARTLSIANCWRQLDTVDKVLRWPELAPPALWCCSVGSQVTESPVLWKAHLGSERRER